MKSLIVLINNPVAKHASDKRTAVASYFLQSKGYKVEVLFTEKKGDAENLAKNAISGSPYFIVAAGGDGTINEVINGVAGTDTPVAILPMGTTNVLAKELGIPDDVRGAMTVAVRSVPKTVSLGKITLRDDHNPRYFVLMAGIGFDGEAVFGINEGLKKISGKGAYIFSGIKTLCRFKPDELTFNVDGKPYSGYSAIIANAAKYGGNFIITPDAKITDPNLYACIFKGRKSLDILRYAFGVTMGRHLEYKDVVYIKAEHMEILGRAHIQIDGDYLGMTPATVEIARDALKMIF